MRKLSKQDIHDILVGCTILGTGGGGGLDEGLELVDKAFDAGKEFILCGLDEIPDDKWIGVPYMCGAPKKSGERVEGAIEEPMPMRAFKAMEEYLGEEFFGVLSTELGGGNTAESLYIAAMLGRVIVDADPAGRSVPELSQSTFYIYDIPIYPLAVASCYGDTAIITNAVSDDRAEALVRALAVASHDMVGVLDHPAKAGQMRGKLVDKAISYALEIGVALRTAAEQGKDSAEAICGAAGGKVLFRGVISKYEYEIREGFTYGDMFLSGEEGEYRIWFKNEYIVSYLNGDVHATVPDLICTIDSKTNKPVFNPRAEVGTNVTVFALPAPDAWKTEKGLEIFGPRHFNIDVDYKPIV